MNFCIFITFVDQGDNFLHVLFHEISLSIARQMSRVATQVLVGPCVVVTKYGNHMARGLKFSK